MAFTTQVLTAFVLNLTVLGFAAATGSLIFAAVRDQLTHAPTRADNRVMSTIRLGFSLGFMSGPVLGSVLGGVAGLRLTLIAPAPLLPLITFLGLSVLAMATPSGSPTYRSTWSCSSAPPIGCVVW